MSLPVEAGPARRLRDVASRAAFPLLVACAALAPLAVHWLAGRTLVWFDTQALYAPQRGLVDEALRAFRLPLWNPHSGAGMPLLADAIHGVLHPVSVLTAWLGTDRSADVLIGGYVACAALGAALLARELGASRAGAVVAALAYATSGFVLSMAGNLVFLAGAGSLPLCAAGLRRFAVDPRPASLALGAGGAAALALSGDAQAAMVGGALALALSWEAAGWRGAVRAAAAGVLGLLVAGAQLVPTAVNLPRTVRDEGVWKAAPEVWALEPWRIPELVVPGLLWGADAWLDPVFEALAGPGHWPVGSTPLPFAASVFVGLVPAALAVVGVGEGRRGRILGIAALALLWLALGPVLGADAALRHVPIWRAFRYSEKLVGPLTLAVAVLAALGLDAIVERRASGRRLLGGAILLAAASIGAARLEAARLAPALAALAEARLARGTWHVLVAAAALGVWLLLRRRMAATWARYALAALAAVGMAAASPAALRPGDPASRLRSAGPVLEAGAPGPRLVTPYAHEPASTGPGRDPLDEEALESFALGYPAYNVRDRLDSMSWYCAMEPKRLALLEAAYRVRWALASRRYAVTHVLLAPPRFEEERTAYALATRDAARRDGAEGPWEVWAVPHREWASFPREVRVVPEEWAAVAELAGASSDATDAVVVEASSRLAAGPGRVLSVDRGLESLRVEAEAPANATLVVADAWWPGWEATVDGTSVPIFPADVLVRAVRWPAGRHVLEMRYRPPEVRTGLLVSALGVALLGAWIAHLRRSRPR